MEEWQLTSGNGIGAQLLEFGFELIGEPLDVLLLTLLGLLEAESIRGRDVVGGVNDEEWGVRETAKRVVREAKGRDCISVEGELPRDEPPPLWLS